MNRSKLTRYLFNFSDAVSWLLIISAVLTLVAAFIPPTITTWSIMSLSPSIMVVLETSNALLGGIGFYLIIKRKIYGFVLIIIYLIANIAFSKFPIIDILYYSAIVLFIVGLPWLVSYKEIYHENKT